MGISRTGLRKRRATGGRRRPIRSKRVFELGRQSANTKLGEQKIHEVRVRGGHKKFRALRLDHGCMSWAGEAVTRKCRILTVVYNATSNEMVRTNTLVKGCIVQVDCTPFKQWYQKYYGVQVGKPLKEKDEKEKKDQPKPKSKGKVAKETPKAAEKKPDEPVKQSRSVVAKLRRRNKIRVLEPALADQFNTGRLYARISSRPGQVGRSDGYILEGEELAFYIKKLTLKKKK